MKIVEITAREIFDSRGIPTVQCEIILDTHHTVLASVPSGLSKGAYEAFELRDNDSQRFEGRGVLKACQNIISVIGPRLVNERLTAEEIDQMLQEIDPSPNWQELGANAVLAVSIAAHRAEALLDNTSLYELLAGKLGSQTIAMPFPLANILNGGLHGKNGLDIQEFMVMPTESLSFRHSMECVSTISSILRNLLEINGYPTAVGDEGGFAPQLPSDTYALDLIATAIEEADKTYGYKALIGLDVAASRFYDPEAELYFLQGAQFTKEKLVDWYVALLRTYPIIYVEDPFHEDDMSSWAALMERVGSSIQIVGDDLTATHPDRIAQAARMVALNTVIIKPNQIGTVSQTIEAIKTCYDNALHVTVSHRSGDTEDTFIADLALACSSLQIKAGGMSRSERLAKYNRLLAIEDRLLKISQ